MIVVEFYGSTIFDVLEKIIFDLSLLLHLECKVVCFFLLRLGRFKSKFRNCLGVKRTIPYAIQLFLRKKRIRPD